MEQSGNMRALICVILFLVCKIEASEDVLVLTVATEDTHGFQRFMRSAKVYGIDVQVLGQGNEWTGGDMNSAGGGMKVNLLKEKLKELAKTDQNKIVLFTDSYDVIFLSSLEDIVTRFKSFPETRVLFSAEEFCWPNSELSSKYPKTDGPNPYLNSGGFIGYHPELLEILNYKEVDDKYDDQLYYTEVYLDSKMREELKISLDHYSAIFQNLNGALSDVEMNSNVTGWPYLQNVVSKEMPLILHGNGPSKLVLNQFGNYLANSWSKENGCVVCKEKAIKLDKNKEKLPPVMVALFIEQATPFLDDFFNVIYEIDYPKSKIHLFVRNNVDYHEKVVEAFYQKVSSKYASAKRIKPSDFISEAEARDIALERCRNSECDFLYSVDSIARPEPMALRYLISSGFDVIAPLLLRPDSAWTNFWGAINSAGFYARSTDYMDIVYRSIVGIWNVPFINNCYLLKMSLFRTQATKDITYVNKNIDPDMAFCDALRNQGIFMHVSNEDMFGRLVNPETYDISRTNPDLYQLNENRFEWHERYIHPEYSTNFLEGRKHAQPCPDVYWFPLMSERFCVEWIEVMEAFGQWSDGSNHDTRLEGGYEAVPTRDIHMNQVGLEKAWLTILKDYVRPLQEMVFTGYYHNPPKSLMNFVVRYRPDEQPSLRPHHDSSTYTINLALNTPHKDYEGGGCHFLRYNCSVRDTKQGWVLMHPGRLTHFHEGLKVTNGTRYIMISFVDP